MSNPRLIYDGECPFCARYVDYLRFRDAVGKVDLVNAREHPDLVREVLAKGYDLDEGMLLEYQGRVYHGADCIHQLALMSTRSDIFNRLTGYVFKSEKMSRILYPVLRAGRNAVLRLLGRTKISGI